MAELGNLWFRENCKVVYPGYGVGTVKGFEDRVLNGSTKTFVVLSFDDAENVSIVRIPLQNLGDVGLRPLSSAEAVTEALGFLDSGAPEILPSWKERFAQHGDMLSSGEILGVAKVLKALWILNSRKPLSFREKKMYQKALLLLTTEVAETRGDDRRKAEELILESLTRACPVAPPK